MLPKKYKKIQPIRNILTIRGIFAHNTDYIQSETGEKFILQEPWWYERRDSIEYFNLKIDNNTNKYWLLQRFLPKQ